MKSYPRLPVGAKHREEARIENWLSMPITLAFILPAGQCDILRLAGWFELFIFHTHQIQDLKTKASNSLSLRLNSVSLQPEEREKAIRPPKEMKMEYERLKQSFIAKSKLTDYLLDLQSQIRYQKAKFTESEIQTTEKIV
jgi:hypothetical protein